MPACCRRWYLAWSIAVRTVAAAPPRPACARRMQSDVEACLLCAHGTRLNAWDGVPLQVDWSS